jgi:hypothetical protein
MTLGIANHERWKNTSAKRRSCTVEDAAEQGDENAQVNLGRLYEEDPRISFIFEVSSSNIRGQLGL